MNDINDSNTKVWNQIYKEGCSILQFPSEHFIRLFHKNLKNKVNRILDWGVGSGNNTVFLGMNSPEVYGVEISQEAAKITKNRFKEELNKEIEIEIISENKVSYDDEFFDCIVSWQVQCYNNDETFKKALSEMDRCLKRKGLLLFTLTDLDDVLFEGSSSISKNTFLSASSGQDGCHLFGLKDIQEINEYLPNFKVKDIGYFKHLLNGVTSYHWTILAEKN